MENGTMKWKMELITYMFVCKGANCIIIFCVNNILSFILKIKNLAVKIIFAFPNFSKFTNNQNELLNKIGVNI